jgi:hypothetical protein
MSNTIFFVAITKSPAEVEVKLRELVKDESNIFKLASDKFYVSYDGLSKDIAEAIGIRGEPKIGSGIVMPITSYSGTAPTSLWEWLDRKMA